MTLKQQGLNCACPLMHRFLSLKMTVVLHDPRLFESSDVEPQIQRANCKVIGEFCLSIFSLSQIKKVVDKNSNLTKVHSLTKARGLTGKARLFLALGLLYHNLAHTLVWPGANLMQVASVIW